MHYIAIFDLLNFNRDRHSANLMLDQNNKIWAIDNELNRGNAWLTYPHWGGCIEVNKILNEPFSLDVREYILSLNEDKIISSSLTPDRKEQANSYLKFLKDSVSQNADTTLDKIFNSLRLIEEKKEEIAFQQEFGTEY